MRKMVGASLAIAFSTCSGVAAAFTVGFVFSERRRRTAVGDVSFSGCSSPVYSTHDQPLGAVGVARHAYSSDAFASAAGSRAESGCGCACASDTGSPSTGLWPSRMGECDG